MSLMPETTSGYITKLDCRHELIFKYGEPSSGDLLWCVKCYEYRTVMHVNENYGVSCDDCRFARKIVGKVAPKTLATSHALRHPGHSVKVYSSTGIEIVQFEPQLLTDLPPF